jgi:hypothetical protein
MSLPFDHASFGDDSLHCPEKSFSQHRCLGRNRISERGQILPFVAVCLAALMGFAGFAVDLGYIQYQQRQQQSAADAAAIAGAQALISNNACPDQSAAQASAYADSASNGFANDTHGVTVSVINPPASGPFSTDNCAVQVNVSSPHTTWFANALGINNAGVTTTATAVVESFEAGVGCLDILDGNLDATGITVTSSKCGVAVNGNINTTGGSITADYVGYSGSLNDTGTGFDEAPATKMLPVPNPCANITGCNYLTNNAPATPAPTSSCASLTVTGKSDYEIPAGCYNSISLTGTTAIMESGTWDVGTINLTGGGITMEPGDFGAISTTGVPIVLEPGLYYFNGSVSNTGGSITGTGVTIYQASGGFNSTGPDDSLSACTTSCTGGAVSGVLYFQPPSNTTASAFTGTSTTAYSGLIYAPSAPVDMTGGGTGYVIYIVGSANITGSSLTDTAPTPAPSAGPTPAGLYVKGSVLVL